MKIRISNFGPIKNFEIDLSRDLIVTYGKNNIGKSYGMSVVYLLLKAFLALDSSSLKKITREEITDKEIESIKNLLGEQEEVKLSGRVNRIIQAVLKKTPVCRTLEKSFSNTFGDLSGIKNTKSKRNPVIELDTGLGSIQVKVSDSVEIKSVSVWKETHGSVRDKREHMVKVTLEVTGDQELKGVFIDLINGILGSIAGIIKRSAESLYFLPASRSGLYTGSTSFFPIIAELSKNRAYITQKIELPGLAEPIADYILHLSHCSRGTVANKHIYNIGEQLETRILKGSVEVDNDTHRLYYRPGDMELELDMNSVSSMVSELSPVVAFLKYILGREPGGEKNGKSKSHLKVKRILFIEEPEAHLHPEAQVLLAEIFVELIRAGVKLVISSHSSYIFNKLSNMVIGKTLDLKEYAPVILAETGKGSVSKLMDADDLGVEDENFVDTAVTLYEERERILEKLNRETDD